MSKRPRRQLKNTPTSAEIQRLVEAEVARRLSQAALPSGAKPRPLNQDALFAQMMAQQAPAKQGTTMFSPGAPLQPSPGLVDPNGPRAFQYLTGYNISSQPRNTESTSFETLRNLASLYDGIQLCEQVWLDTVAKLNLVIKPRPEIIAEQGQSASNTRYAEKIRKYTDILSVPDPGNGYDLKTWLRAAVRDQLQIDAVAVYIRRNRAGGVFSLELVDGVTIKPLIDPRGRRPQPPYPAYQQFYYGVPDGLYTSDEMIYLRETTRTDSIYGLSRIERIIVRVNQALRKQNKDLVRFTDGNIPPGLIEPPAESGEQWTPEQLAAYQTMWDAMLAGNDQARSRVRIMAPGSTYTAIEEPDIFLDFDRFLLNITTACYSMTMADLGFTESVNKSSGDSQENVFYRRAVQPLMDRYAQLFTQILRNNFGEQDLIVTWGGFEEAEDFNSMATSYVALVNSGIISPTVAAHQLKLPTSGTDIPNFVLVPGQGITFLEDAANPEMRKAANDAKKAGYEQASNPPPPPEPNDVGVPPGQAIEQPEKLQSDDAQAAKGDDKPQDGEEDKAKPAAPAKKSGVQRSVGSNEHTGMMVAFMLKSDAASQLALPGGEDPLAMHCTLAYLGNMNDLPGDDSLRPDTSPDKIKGALADFAQKAHTLQGKTSGIARFATSDALSPIVALVNMPGLQDFRNSLVMAIEAAGYSVSKNFDGYIPHITLSYIPQDAPMPVNASPSVPLIFDEICLAIGDEHSYFKIGDVPSERQGKLDFFALAVDSGKEQRNFDPAQPRGDHGRWTGTGEKAKAEKAAAKEAAAKAKAEKAAAAEKAKAEKAAAKEAAAKATKASATKAKADEEAKASATKAKADEEAKASATKAKADEEAKASATKAKADEEAKASATKAKADEEAKASATKAKADEEAKASATKAKADIEAANKKLAEAQANKAAAYEDLHEKEAAYKDAKAKADAADEANKAAAYKDLAEKSQALKDAYEKTNAADEAKEAAMAEADWLKSEHTVETGSKMTSGKKSKAGSKKTFSASAWDELLAGGGGGPKPDEFDPHLEEKEQYIEENGGKEWLESLTPDEKSGITAYSGIGYNYMQSHLRGIKEAGKRIQKGIKDATSGLMKGKAPKDMIVLRATKDFEHNLIVDANLKGEHYVAKGFSSTTIEEKPKSSFGNKIQHITIPKGSPGAYIKPISHHKNESEWLLPPNAKFRIDSISDNEAYLTYLGVHK